MRKQNAKFFCESCGEEVAQNARFCTHCGRFFSSVRCPVCGESGNPNKFADGCPKCGYAFEPDKKVSAPKEKKNHVSRRTKKRFLRAVSLQSAAAAGYRPADESLPGWLYALTASVLCCVLVGLFFYFAHSTY